MSLGVLFALAGALVSGVFAVQLARQFVARRRHHALAWTIALGCYTVGMLALAVGFAIGWSPVVYGVYWFTGALAAVAYLGVGQLHLLDPARALVWWTLAGLATVWTAATMLLTGYDAGVLAAATEAGSIPAGREVFDGGLAYQILRPITMSATLVVVGGCLWSGIRTKRYGILLIALGVIVSASSSSFLRAGLDDWVAVALAAGAAIMYAGFRAAAKPPRGRSVRPAADARAGS